MAENNTDFDTCFHRLLGHEGGYVNNPNDPGGPTKWGVTQRVARANGYAGDMKDFPVQKAKQIYLADYWKPIRADELPAGIRYAVFDAAVNSGVSQAIKWLQRAVKVQEDGKLGSLTLAAAKALSSDLVRSRMLAYRLRFMTDLGTWSTFGKGWARRIADLLEN